MRKLLQSIFIVLGLKYTITQYTIGRKLYQGTWYYIDTWITLPFWTQQKIYSVGARILRTESYATYESGRPPETHSTSK